MRLLDGYSLEPDELIVTLGMAFAMVSEMSGIVSAMKNRLTQSRID